MNQIEKLDQLINIVGLLRSQFSNIMKTLHDYIQSFKTQYRHPPEKIYALMGETQGNFAVLLKMTEFLSTSKENLKLQRKDHFDSYLEAWIVSQTTEYMGDIMAFIEKLNKTSIESLKFDCEVLKKSSQLVTKAIIILK